MSSLASLPCRRQAVRRWVRIPAEVVRARDFVRVGGCVLDLSEDGLRARGEPVLDIGDEVIVAFRAPASEQWIERMGWVTHVARDDSFGVVFEPGDDDVRGELSEVLARLPPVIPRRESGTYLRAVD